MPAELALCISPDVVAQDVGDGLILLNLRTGIYWGLNRTGAVVWRGIEKHAGIGQICSQLRDEFDGSGEDLAAAVQNLLSELAAERLIVEAAPRGQKAPEIAEGAGRRAPQPKKSAAAKHAAKKNARKRIPRKTPGK